MGRQSLGPRSLRSSKMPVWNPKRRNSAPFGKTLLSDNISGRTVAPPTPKKTNFSQKPKSVDVAKDFDNDVLNDS